jgi:glucose dehydrogenase
MSETPPTPATANAGRVTSMRRKTATLTRTLGFCACIALPLVVGAASPVAQAQQQSQDWRHYGGHADQDHYSSLSQINRTNVKNLTVAWKFSLDETTILEATPVVIGRVLYTYTPSMKIIALNATSGKLLWTFDSGIRPPSQCRGVTYWTDGKESRLLAGIKNFLYALDPATGKPIRSFGENGRIDLRKNLRGDYETQSVALTSPGVIYKDLIIVGGLNPETPPAPPGDIRAFDVHTGKLRWRFHTIPHPGEPGYDTWPKDAWKSAGAANNWAGMAVDTKRGIVYAPTGSAVYDFYGGNRAGNDLFANSLLALDAKTGKLIWYFQGVHHDLWDRDFPSPPSLVTVKRNGKSVDAVAQTTKQGWLFLFDRANGQPLFPIEERRYPPSDVPGEIASPTQPYPLKPEPYTKQILTEDMLTERTPEAHAWAVEQFRTFRSEGQFVPNSVGKLTVMYPGPNGGAEWGGSAVDRNTGVIYVNANDYAMTSMFVKNDPTASLGLKTYQSQCSGCHGANRAGSSSFPSLVDVAKRLTLTQIAEIIHQGRGRMSSFPNLQDGKLEALLEYLRTGEGNLVWDPNRPQPTGEMSDPSLSSDNPVSVAGTRVYKSKCAMCHGEAREGKAPSIPNLIGLGARLAPTQILDRIHNGKGIMPAFPQLQGQDLNALMRYLNASETGAKPEDEPDAAIPYTLTGYLWFLDPEGYPANSPPWGTLNAIDLNTGEYLWKLPLGEYPELVAKGMATTGTQNIGGPIVTAGGLLFIGATIFDRKIRAFDSHNGTLLWETQLPFAGTDTPATYMVDGKQYLVIATSGARDPKGPQGTEYVAFALP